MNISKEREVIKVMIKKITDNALWEACGLFDLWIAISYFDVILHNLTTHQYFPWNFFVIFFT